MRPPQVLGIIAGNGVYPRLLVDAAQKAGVKKIIAAAFNGETDPVLAEHVDLIEWMRVGQLNRLLKFFNQNKVHHAIMAGQIAPKNLFDLRPDWKALLLLGKLKERNAESIFGAIAEELTRIDVELLPATTFLEDCLVPAGLITGAKLSRCEEEDVDLGWKIAKEIARLDIGQTVIVKNGTVVRSEEHTSELQSLTNLVCRLLLEKKNTKHKITITNDGSIRRRKGDTTPRSEQCEPKHTTRKRYCIHTYYDSDKTIIHQRQSH